MFSVNGSDADTPLANCVDGIDPLHQKFSLKANVAASFLINVFVSLAIYRDRKFITPGIIQDDSDTVRNPRFLKIYSKLGLIWVGVTLVGEGKPQGSGRGRGRVYLIITRILDFSNTNYSSKLLTIIYETVALHIPLPS